MSINEAITRPLTGFELSNLFDDQIKIYKYGQLSNFEDINNAFYPYNIMFILYETRRNFGHWCVLCKDAYNIYFFDPYGIVPDDQLNFTDINIRFERNMILPHLTYLLYKSGKTIHFNPYAFQNINNDNIATCGRWCAVYALIFDFMTIDEFANFVANTSNYPDHLITILTEQYL